MLQTPLDQHRETGPSIPTRTSTGRHTSTVPAVVACGASALALLVADMLAVHSFIGPQMRGLALVVILASAVVGATIWIDRRQVARHEELLASRKPGDCCAVAWVEGLAHRPFPGMNMPHPGQH